MGSLISKDCYDYVLYEWDNGDYEINRLRNCFSGLTYNNQRDLADNFYKLCLDATEGTIENRTGDSDALEYQKAELQKRKNDLKYIQSLGAFKTGLKNYFKAYGKKSIPHDELYIEFQGNSIRKQADSNFIFRYLIEFSRSGHSVLLSECLQTLEQNDFFDYYRANEILNYQYRDDETDRILLPILKEYYFSNLPNAKFENCLWTDEDGYHWLYKESLLGEIFKKFRFPTPLKYLLKLVWLDKSGVRSFDKTAFRNTDSLSKLILDSLNNEGIIAFKKEIVENLKTGIKLDGVFGTHIALCKHLQIKNATDSILKYIKNNDINSLNKIDMVNVFLDLGGNRDDLLLLYKSMDDYNDYLFIRMTQLFYESYPKEVEVIGIKALQAKETNQENKIYIAQCLAQTGNIDGFIYLMEQVRSEKKSPYHIQGGHHVYNVDTKKGLKELEDIMYLLVDEKYDSDRFHDTAKSIIIEWLNGFAAKSEEDLELVLEFLDASKKSLMDNYAEVLDINWYKNRILENFRDSDKSGKSIFEIKKIIANVTH